VSGSTPVCTIDLTGITVPTYEDVLDYLIGQYQSIYGSDVYLGNDSQDGQLLAVFALAIHDVNSMAAAVYAAYSPQTAQGEGLSSVVKINGIARAVATNSTVDLKLIGQNGTQVINGIVRDTNNNNWLLPATVTIPAAGEVTVTAVAASSGAIAAAPGTVTKMLTPVVGWQSVSNFGAAVQGDPVESDAALRQRQTVSTALPSLTVLDGLIGAIAAIPGVIRYVAYENDTTVTDNNGVPPYSLAMIVDGGDASDIATAIMLKKTPGVPTYGTTSQAVTDSFGNTRTINFFRPTQVPITVALTIQPLTGYTTSTANAVAAAIAASISALPIGQSVQFTRLYGAAYGLAGGLGITFELASLTIARAGTPTPADVPIAFNEAAVCTIDNIAMTVLVH
jgi:uncharacterized phage protein gp47/JayE